MDETRASSNPPHSEAESEVSEPMEEEEAGVLADGEEEKGDVADSGGGEPLPKAKKVPFNTKIS